MLVDYEIIGGHSKPERFQNITSVLFLSDGLVDCLDPDCCLQSTCQNSLLCRGSRDPLDIIQQSHSGSPAVKSFYDRIKLLVGKDSTHIIPGENPFNSR